MPDETSPLVAEQNRNGDYGTTAHDAERDADSHKPQVSLPTILIPMAIGIFLCAMDQTIVVSSYAAIGSELNQLQNTSWIATAYMMTLTSFQPLYGKMRQAMLLLVSTEFKFLITSQRYLRAQAVSALCLLCLCDRLPLLQFFQNFARAHLGPWPRWHRWRWDEYVSCIHAFMQRKAVHNKCRVVSIIMSDIVPLRSRGTWQGIMNIIYASGSASGAPLGGFLSDTIGWRWGFLIQVPAIALAFIIVSFALHLPHRDTSDFKTKLKRVDFSGALSLVLCVFFLLFGLDRGGNIAWNDKYTISAFSAFTAFLVLFIYVELVWAAEPFAPKRIIAHRSLVGAYMVNLFALMGAFSMIFHVSLFYQAVLGKAPSEVGFWLLPTVFSGVIGSLGGGLYIQATGRYYWITFYAYVAMLVGMIGTVLQAGIITTSAVGVAFASFVTAIGNGTGITTSLIALISNAGPADQAIATAVSYLFRSLGSVVGLSIGSALLQLSLRTSLRKALSDDVDVDEIIRRVRESLTYIDELDAVTAGIVRTAYESAVRVTMWFSTAMAGCALVSAAFIREKAIVSRRDQREREGVVE
ncbi:Vacuolar membrane amino acid uptake transporter fnx2 [Mycena venus]|uniref:Vacuolar membrane amino acid uptake transporter fnx2 n=1 Tax=Mycena venus TaxID=2733690 RepID=A0A8H7CZS9_9AGAR|nr:Vacuolar membrane amino acid uptake transporter fnx2 [Mycena venus]